MMFQGPKGYIAQICEVHLQKGNSTTKWPFYTFFLENSTLIYILFSLVKTIHRLLVRTILLSLFNTKLVVSQLKQKTCDTISLRHHLFGRRY